MKAEMFMFIDQVLLAAGAIGVYVWFRRPEQKLKESQDMTLRCFDHLWSVRVLLQYSFFKLSWQPRLQKQQKITLLGTNTSPNKVLLSRWFCFSPGGICDRSLEGISDLADLDLFLPSWFGTPDFLCRTNRGRAHRLRGKSYFEWCWFLVVVSDIFMFNPFLFSTKSSRVYVMNWWFQMFFTLTPTWGSDPIWGTYFSEGLTPPTTAVIPRKSKTIDINSPPRNWLIL